MDCKLSKESKTQALRENRRNLIMALELVLKVKMIGASGEI